MRLHCLLAFAALLAACSAPYKVPVLAATPGSTTEFEGVVDLLHAERPLDVLFVHGMCTHDALWAEQAVQDLYGALGGDAAAVHLVPSTVEGTSITLFQQTLPLPRGRLHANAILWSPLTTPLKAQLCYDQTDKSKTCPPSDAAKPYPYERATLNRQLKDVILNDCLSDAVIYQGTARDEINRQMQRALLQATATSGGVARSSDFALEAARVPASVPLVVLTDSLGSKVAFDAILKLANANAQDTARAGERIFDRTTSVFMAANQLPLLSLADQNLDGSVASRDGYPADPLAALIRQRSLRTSPPAAASQPRVVAFTDPNDLLSYILVPRPQQTPYAVVDVVVSNATTYFGAVELPNQAHLRYHANRRVRDLIACGHPTSRACVR
jgi:hypothetical protein